eukprot:Amastigsp_a684002_5.p2 type:complete len:139 gc:universal Amastigsp_a684002_5:521-937(+)
MSGASRLAPGNVLVFTRLRVIVISSWTIAWYVHCESSGVTGSSRRSRMSSSGTDGCVNSAKISSLRTTRLRRSSASARARADVPEYRIDGRCLSAQSDAKRPSDTRWRISGCQVSMVGPPTEGRLSENKFVLIASMSA